MKTTSTDQSSNTTLDDTYLTGSGYWDVSSSTTSTGLVCGSGGFSTTTIDAINTVDSGISIFGMKEKEWRDLPGRIEKIEKMIGILCDEPSPEVLEKHKALKDAYHRYKMVEKMILGSQDSET